MKKRNAKQVILPLITSFIWGSSFVAQSLGAGKVGGFTFTASRSIPAVLVLGALVLGEVMTPVQLAGACCIIGGALVGEARAKLPAAQRRRMRRAYVRLVRAQRRVLHHAA